MDPQHIPTPDQVTPEFTKFREESATAGLKWTPEETLAAWTQFKADNAGKGKKGK